MCRPILIPGSQLLRLVLLVLLSAGCAETAPEPAPAAEAETSAAAPHPARPGDFSSALPVLGDDAPAADVTPRAPAAPATDLRDTPPAWAGTVYPTAAIACDHPAASKVGLEILQAGGNAVDAAVAASFALSVVRPYSCGIGGGGFMIVHLADEGRAVAFDYRERALAAVGPDYFVDRPDADSQYSGHAVAIPGTVAGLLQALEAHGTMERATVMAPAIRLARMGFVIDAHHAGMAMQIAMTIDPNTADAAPVAERHGYVWRQFLATGAGTLLDAGSILRNEAQARALEQIALHGRDGFYGGPVAAAVVQAAQAAGGALTLDDLRGYRPVEIEPLVSDFNGRTLITMPPPSSGGICLLQVFEILERIGAADSAVSEATSFDDPSFAHAFTEALKHAFADRARWLGDTEYVEVPMDLLLHAGYLDGRAALYDSRTTLEASAYGYAVPQLPADTGTSHISVVDAQGNAVACTETINTLFGSRVGVPGYGFCLNNEMDDFLTRPGEVNAYGLTQASSNLPAPGKRPLSSMSPTIVLGVTGDVEIVAGGSGGPRIISGTLQAVLQVLRFDTSAYDAVAAPRFHHQWSPDVLQLEPAMRGSALSAALAARGHEIGERAEVGVVQLIRRTAGGWQAASDPRKGGAPAGY